jgi:hypothetical protein
LWQAGQERLLPGAWLLLYGCAVLSASMMTSTAIIRLIAAMGALFVAFGILAFELPPYWQNVVLGSGFGGLHLVFGILIGRINRLQPT